MYILQGFIGYPELVDNNIGVVAKLGEISKDSLTYAIETGFFKNPTYQGTQLFTFTSDDSVQGKITTPQNFVDLSLEIASRLLTLAKAGTLTANRVTTINQIEFSFSSRIEDLNIGEMVTDLNIYLPEYIEFKVRGEESFVRLWFADESFSKQYDGFEYKFIGPVENLDVFFMARPVILNEVSKNNTTYLMNRVMGVRGNDPYTSLFPLEYNWINPTNPEDKIAVTWTSLVYGRVGINEEAVRNSLIEWILENSSHTREEWVEIFPDLFTPTEYILTPYWHKYAIPNQTIVSGFKSPVTNVREILDVVSKTAKGIGYSSEDLILNTSVTTTNLMGMTLLFTGSANNRNEIYRMYDMFGDYINVSPQSADFQRMSLRTQLWIRTLNEMLILADRLEKHSFVPLGFTKITRDNVVYLVKMFDNVQYLTVLRYSLLELLELKAPYVPEFADNGAGCGCYNDEELLELHSNDTNNPHNLTPQAISLLIDPSTELIEGNNLLEELEAAFEQL